MLDSRAKLDAVVQHLAVGHAGEAARICREVIAKEPTNLAALALAGSADLAGGAPESAAQWLERALRLAPEHPLLHANLGEAYRRSGRTNDALRHLRRALAIKKDMPEAHYNLGLAFFNLSQWYDAIASFEAALALRPDIDAEGHYKDALWRGGDRDRAIAYQRQWASRHSEDPAAHFELGTLLSAANLPDDAVTSFERAHALRPLHRDTLVQLTTALVSSGRLDDVFRTLDKLIEMGGDTASFASQKLFLRQYDPTFDTARIAREAAMWRERYVEGASIAPLRPTPLKDRAKRLRIGYVSSHFLAHVSAFFVLPLLRNHARAEFEIYGYSNARTSDR
ncbi:MAG: tetratricopeptide repeat protein, partial [Polyangiaceae bacterium]